MRHRESALIFIGFGIICFSFAFTSCENEDQKKREQAQAIAEMDEILYREPAELLSAKYSIATNTIFNLLREENNPNYFPDETFEDRIMGRNTRERIRKYSNNYGLPEKVIASIFIDFKAMQ